VKANYTGKFTNNTSFDGGVASFPLSGVIARWQIGIPLIKQGGKVKLIIPPYLAYGCNDYRGFLAIPYWYLMWSYWRFSEARRETIES
jgi:FKBP-type peptidyl-prolyl cis-trans isomerase FkpA